MKFLVLSLLSSLLLLNFASSQSALNEAKKLYDQERSKTKPAAPPTAPAGQNFSNVPVPPPKVLPKATPPPSNEENITIDANSATFDEGSNRAIFRGHVRLRSATKDIDCEELDVTFKEDPTKDKDKAPAPPPKPVTPAPVFDPAKPNAPAGAPEAPKEIKATQIEKAIARGNGSTVTIVTRGNKPAVCKCGEATFDDKTGNMVMRIFPEAEQEGTRLQATERGTILTMNRAGNINAEGPVKTIKSNDPKPGATDASPKPKAP